MAHESEDSLLGAIVPDVEPAPEELLHVTPDIGEPVIQPGFLGRSQAFLASEHHQQPSVETPDEFDGTHGNLSAAPLVPGEPVILSGAFGHNLSLLRNE